MDSERDMAGCRRMWQDRPMPKLIYRANIPGEPKMNECSDCGHVFSGELADIERAFDAHCAEKHNPKQDVNQAAARIVREAIKG